MITRAPLNQPNPGPPATLSRMLTQDGDARLILDRLTGLNRYGCLPHPGRPRPAFGSSTGSTISPAAFTAAQALHKRVAGADPSMQASEFDRLRGELAVLCGVAGLGGCEIIFAASGTDLHLIAAQLSGDGRENAAAGAAPLRVVMTEASDTGTGVPAALAGRHYNARAPLAGPVTEGDSLPGCHAVELRAIPSRGAEGVLRPASELDAEVEAQVAQAAEAGQNVLLIVSDISKTGLLAPSPGRALALLRRFPGRVDVLVDACQFRLAPETLRSYVDHGFLVALTGSKFVTGPAFSGALLVPPALARQWRQRPLPASLAAYSARADWPKGWAGRESLTREASLGLLLRWEAALTELKAFRTLPQPDIAAFLRRFADAVQARLARDGAFEALPMGAMDRGPVAAGAGWDTVPSLFPFLLKRGKTDPLGHEETRAVYRALMEGYGQIGQPAHCGLRRGRAVSALRICSSARLAVDALAPKGRGTDAVIAEALALLDQTAQLARKLSAS